MRLKKTTRLKSLLKEKGMTQKELSIKSEIAEYKISMLCTGQSKNLHLTTAKRICDVLECSIDDAFGDIEASDID